ncbi:MAG TPA: hypothetical protein VNI61_10355 [Gemmatimonadales bacterium]|nr:hypothetical protein [Gemmatimonadales bacterium]
MPPTWAEVVSAVALVVIALAAVGAAGAAVLVARELRAFFRAVEHLAGPALQDVRQLVGTIKTEADALAGTSRDLRTRIVRAADAAEARLADLDALLDVVQEEVEETALDVATTLRDVRSGARWWRWVRKLLAAPDRRKRRRR